MTRPTQMVLALAALCVAAAFAAGVLLVKGDQDHCRDVKRQGTEMQRDADAAVSHGDYAGERRLVGDMAQLVRNNESCFTEAEIARVETVMGILKP